MPHHRLDDPWELEHEELEEFEPLIREIHHDLHAAGVEAFRREGGSLKLIKRSKKARKRFVKLCHRGHARGQNKILEKMIETSDLQDQTETDLKDARRTLNNENEKRYLEKLNILKNREWALRSLADTLALQAFRDEKWAIRRLMYRRHQPSVSEAALRSAQRYVERENRRNPYSFSLITDLTTSIAAGDVLRTAPLGPPPNLVSIELKQGKVNRRILDVLGSTGEPDPKQLRDFKAEYGQSGINQLERIQRQEDRLKRSWEVIRTEKGEDVRTGEPIKISREEADTDFWGKDFLKVVEEAQKSNGYVKGLDGTLFVVAYRSDTGLPDIAVLDLIYRMLEPDEPSFLEEGPKGLEKIQDRVQPIVDFRDSLFCGAYLAPWLLAADLETRMDIVFGRLRVFVYLDPEGLISLSERMDLPIRWSKKSERAKYAERDKAASPMQFSDNFLVTDTEDWRITLGPGMWQRAVFDFVTPRSVVRMMYHEMDEATEWIENRQSKPK